MNIKTYKNIILSVFLSLPLLSACGLKGELYQTPVEQIDNSVAQKKQAVNRNPIADEKTTAQK